MTVDSPGSAIRLHRATGFLERLVGLLGRTSLAPNEALLIERCRAVHTLGMRMTIDVVFLSDRGVVVGMAERLAPWRMASCAMARHVLELSEGGAHRLKLELGTCVFFGATSLQIVRQDEAESK